MHNLTNILSHEQNFLQHRCTQLTMTKYCVTSVKKYQKTLQTSCNLHSTSISTHQFKKSKPDKFLLGHTSQNCGVSHNVTCHPTQVNTPRLNPSQWRLVLALPTLEGWKAELTYVTWLCHGRESNPRPLDRKSNTLTAVPPRHHDM